ncbi:MAG: Smr/MutS family protein [Syntrophobacterales bacterium]|nr:Smr/MutS family protein [Syntrophobacterales bacterium]
MNRRKTENRYENNSYPFLKYPLYTPFEKLKEKVFSSKAKHQQVEASIKTTTTPLKQDSFNISDEALFAEAMKDVIPLKSKKDEANRVPPPRPTDNTPRYFSISELDAYNELYELTSGNMSFDLFYSDEYVEGAVQGISPQLLRKLRRGEFSYQDYLDLHGLTKREAQERVITFVKRAHLRGNRCILIIPGRGLNSADNKPILKEGLIRWLTHHPLKNIVLAFSSARAHDGGLGAFYVLLRRVKKKGHFSVRNFPL